MPHIGPTPRPIRNLTNRKRVCLAPRLEVSELDCSAVRRCYEAGGEAYNLQTVHGGSHREPFRSRDAPETGLSDFDVRSILISALFAATVVIIVHEAKQDVPDLLAMIEFLLQCA
jgi:hypothetical protein